MGALPSKLAQVIYLHLARFTRHLFQGLRYLAYLELTSQICYFTGGTTSQSSVFRTLTRLLLCIRSSLLLLLSALSGATDSSEKATP